MYKVPSTKYNSFLSLNSNLTFEVFGFQNLKGLDFINLEGLGFQKLKGLDSKNLKGLKKKPSRLEKTFEVINV